MTLETRRRYGRALFAMLLASAVGACSGGNGGGGGDGLTGSVDRGTASGRLFFSGFDSTHGVEPWVSDGTADGTRMLTDIAGGNSNPQDFTPLGDAVIFTAETTATGRELWLTDGELTSARQLTDLNGADDGVDAGQPFAVLEGFAYFRANDPTKGGAELWRTNGNQTVLVADIGGSSVQSAPHGFTVFDRHVFFAADGGDGIELWRTDGQTATQVADINPAGDASPANLVVAADDLYFTVEQDPGERELWRLDHANGTPRELEVNDSATEGADIRHLTPFSRGVVFAADGGDGFEPWVAPDIDGEPDQLEDINPGSGNGLKPESKPFVANGFFYFAADDSGSTYTPWASDADTSADPRRVPSNATDRPTLTGAPGSFAVLDDEVFFPGTTSAAGTELWRFNDTATEVSLAADINPSAGTGSSPSSFAVFDGALYFGADDGSGRRLWRFRNGTTEPVSASGPTQVAFVTVIN